MIGKRETFLFETKVTWSSAFDFLWVILTDILQHSKCFNFVVEGGRALLHFNEILTVQCAVQRWSITPHYPRLLESI